MVLDIVFLRHTSGEGGVGYARPVPMCQCAMGLFFSGGRGVTVGRCLTVPRHAIV